LAQLACHPPLLESLMVFSGALAALNALRARRNQFYQQVNENGMVKQELDFLSETTPVYKLIGPVLMKQDLPDAKQNVDKRIEMIQREMEKLEKQINEKEELHTEARKKIMAMQQDMKAKAAEEVQKIVDEMKE
ncbi:unnamed protein product, partial [Chrysoparadoxa australica]